MWSSLANFLRISAGVLPVCLAIPIDVPPGNPDICPIPQIKVSTVTKETQGPYRMTGTDVTVVKGGSASFSKTYSYSTTLTYTVGIVGEDDFSAIEELAANLGFSFSISKTTQTSITVDTTCPINTGVGQNNNDTVTWGIEYYEFVNCAIGTVTFGNYTPGDGDSMEMCTPEAAAHKTDPGTFPYQVCSNAVQAGAEDGSGDEQTPECCTNSESDPWPGSPVCPVAT